MTEPRKPQGYVSQTDPTTPAMQAQRPGHISENVHHARVTTKDDEAVEMLQAEYPGAPRWGLGFCGMRLSA